MDALSWQQRGGLFLLFALIAAIPLTPLFSNTLIPTSLDYLNHLNAIIQAKLALMAGQFPLRVAPTSNGGWQYPLFQFYSPTSYTIAGLIHRWLTPTNPFIAYKLTLWLVDMIGSIYLYRLAYGMVKSLPAAIFACVVYFTAPYNIIIIDHLGAFNEAIAMGVIPIVLFYTLQCYEHASTWKIFLKVGLAWYVLATTHLITFINTSFFVAMLLLLLTSRNPWRWKKLIYVGIAYAFGCLLAMWYLAPIALLSSYLLINHTFTSLAMFYAHSPSLIDLLAPIATLTSTALTSDGFIDAIARIHPTIGLPILLAASISIYVFCNRLYAPSLMSAGTANDWLYSLLLTFFIIFILAWSPINFWRWLPSSLMVIQYSWRLLAQITWVGALLTAWSVCWIMESHFANRYIMLGIALTIFSTSTWLVSKGEYVNFYDYLSYIPPGSNTYLIDAKKYPAFIKFIYSPKLALEGSILSVSQSAPHCLRQNNHTLCNISVPPTVRLIELPIFYYPGLLNITVNNKLVPYMGAFDQNQLLTVVQAQPGLNNIHMQFRGLLGANFISSLAWGIGGLSALFIILQNLLSRFATASSRGLDSKGNRIVDIS